MKRRYSRKAYDHELRVACELARTAGAAILEHYEGPLHIKQKNYDDDTEPVTQADTIANDLIVTGLKREFPDDGILAEESVDTKRRLEKSRVWMVDPLDGTNGFIDGNGDFAVQIGLAEERRVCRRRGLSTTDGRALSRRAWRRNMDRASAVRAGAGEGFRQENPRGDAFGREPFASQPAHEQSRHTAWLSRKKCNAAR